MKYGGNLSDLRGTMESAHGIMENLAGITHSVVQAVRPMGMAGMGSTSAGMYVDGGVGASYGAEAAITNVTTNPATGNTVMTFGDGSTKIYNAQNQDVTANFETAPSFGGALSNVAQSVSDSVSNVAKGAGTLVTTGLSNVATIAVVAGIVYVVYKMDKAK